MSGRRFVFLSLSELYLLYTKDEFGQLEHSMDEQTSCGVVVKLVVVINVDINDISRGKIEVLLEGIRDEISQIYSPRNTH